MGWGVLLIMGIGFLAIHHMQFSGRKKDKK